MQSTTAADMPKITLHWLEVSRSHRILWLLEELKIPYELKTYKRGADKLADPALKKVHPLGKSPVVTVLVPGQTEPVVLIESAAITEYLCDYYGKWLVPQRFAGSGEGKVGGETEQWLRYRTFMHYAEGSIMPFMVMSLVVSSIKEASVPFFIRPVTNGVADRIFSTFLKPNFVTHLKWIESQLQTAPGGGKYLCGEEITAADILMSFPLQAGRLRSGLTKEELPLLWAYVDRLEAREAYKTAVDKIVAIEGDFKTNL